MPQISIIKKSDVQEARRFDAEFFKLEYLEIEEKLDNLKHFYLSKNEVVSGPFGSTLKSEEYLNEGVYFVRVQDIRQRFFLEKENMVCISEDSNNKIKNSELKQGDLVVSKVGNTIGLIARIDNEMKRANVSENNIGIKLENYNEEIKYFILTFLNSKYGQNQILRRISGNAQPKLNVFNFTDLKIPILPQSFQLQIEKIVKFAYEKQTQSKQLYKQAEETLLKEVDLLPARRSLGKGGDYKLEHILSFQTTKKETDEAGRFDAEYF
ncbi:restriction endonuclease subunit S, partial [Candidatus Parcubacteria bacterium]|nr:restriction endonuclease subunit S [Candidatus Parcubacteria bacterium]